MNNKLTTLTLCMSTLIGCGGSDVQAKEDNNPYVGENLTLVKSYTGGENLYQEASGSRCYLSQRVYASNPITLVNCEDFLGDSKQILRDKRSHKQQAEQYSELLRKLWNEKVDSKCEYGHTWPLSQDSQYGYTAWSRAFEREIDCAEPDLQQIAEEKALLETLKKKYEK